MEKRFRFFLVPNLLHNLYTSATNVSGVASLQQLLSMSQYWNPYHTYICIYQVLKALVNSLNGWKNVWVEWNFCGGLNFRSQHYHCWSQAGVNKYFYSILNRFLLGCVYLQFCSSFSCVWEYFTYPCRQAGRIATTMTHNECWLAAAVCDCWVLACSDLLTDGRAIHLQSIVFVRTNWICNCALFRIISFFFCSGTKFIMKMQ